jgi:hypothetical protein
MNRSQFEHIIRASGAITGCREFVVVGSQAILTLGFSLVLVVPFALAPSFPGPQQRTCALRARQIQSG